MTDDSNAADTTPAKPATAKRTAPRRSSTGTRARSRSVTRAKSMPRQAEIRQFIDDAGDDIDDRVEGLSQQVVALRDQIGALAGRTSEGAQQLATRAGHQIHRAAAATRENPLPLAVGLGILALLSALLFTRRDNRWH